MGKHSKRETNPTGIDDGNEIWADSKDDLGRIDRGLVLVEEEERAECTPIEQTLRRMLRRSRGVTLGPGLTTPAQIRADLLERVNRAAQNDASDRERQETAEWRRQVESATDEQLWELYRDQWGTDARESRCIEHRPKDAEFEHEAGWFARAEREADRADEYGPGDV